MVFAEEADGTKLSLCCGVCTGWNKVQIQIESHNSDDQVASSPAMASSPVACDSQYHDDARMIHEPEDGPLDDPDPLVEVSSAR